MQIEDGITEKRIFPSRLRKIFKQTAFPSSVEDDHKPFEKQGEISKTIGAQSLKLMAE